MEKLTRSILPTSNIVEINLCMVDIKIYLYLYLVFHLGYFNTPKSVLFTKQLADD